MRIANGMQLSPTQNLLGNGSQASAKNETVASYLPSDNPTSLLAWFRMGVGVTVTGAGVSTWADQSGNGHDLLQATDTNRPAYDGSAIITFDGVDNDLKCAAFTLNQPIQISMLASHVWARAKYYFDGDTGDTVLAFVTGVAVTPKFMIYAGATTPEDANWTSGIATFSAVTCLFAGTSSSIKVNTSSETTGNAGTGNAGGFTLGSRGTGSTNFANMAVKEIIIRNVNDATIRAADHAYLQTL